MAKNTRKRPVINYLESSSDEQTADSGDDEIEQSSDDEQNVLESDDFDHGSELGLNDFDSEDELNTSQHYSDSGSVQWSKNPPDLREINIIARCRLSAGLLPPVLHCRNIVDFFQAFIDRTMLQHIVDCTNRRFNEELTI